MAILEAFALGAQPVGRRYAAGAEGEPRQGMRGQEVGAARSCSQGIRIDHEGADAAGGDGAVRPGLRGLVRANTQ
jgi:hypothetical protein